MKKEWSLWGKLLGIKPEVYTHISEENWVYKKEKKEGDNGNK